MKTITKNKKNCNNILMMKIDGEFTTHYQTVAENFNHYDVSVATTVITVSPLLIIQIKSTC
jgi:hypothetical protein